MNSDKQKIVNRPLLPIYNPARIIDILCVLLIFIGMLLSAGFFSSSPGSLIVPFCNLLLSWFGTWAVVYSMMMIVIGITLLLLRWVFPKIRMSRGKQILYAVLFLVILWTGLTLSALYGGKEAGGSLGLTYVQMLTNGHPAEQVSFWLWAILVISICLLAGGTKWIPKLFRALAGEVKSLVMGLTQKPKQVTEKSDPAEFDWRQEYQASENALKKTKQEEKKEVFREEKRVDDGVPAVVPEKKPQNSIPAFFTKKKTMENIELNNTEKKSTTIPVNNGNQAVRSNRLPPLNLLDTELGFYGQNADHSQFIADIEEAMEEFGTPVHVIGCSVGPSVVQYQVVPGTITKPGKENGKNIRVSQVAQTERDLAVRLGVSNLSIQAPVPGESYIGIDIPNPQTMKVRLRPLIESPEFQRKHSPLTVALGRDITGDPVVVDLGSMPHLLVAGTTNSGKSICLRAMAICLAMNNTPEQLRFVMIDPKRVEFYHFNGLPHLLGKVETEYERSVAVLQWAVQEMMSRYELFEKVGARKLENYNKYAQEHGLKPLPYIVIIIDEMSELMKGADKQGEVCIDKLASLSRATGMHMILATQRPDVSVITGKIKTNIPARIALTVASSVDSRVIMDKQGAEKLLGRGDMYFVDPSLNVPVRVQGPLLTDNEIDKVVSLWKKLSPKPTAEMNSTPWDEIAENSKQSENSKDEKKLKDAIRLVTRTKKASAAYISGKINVSFPTASRLLNRMEELGVVGPMQLGGKAREVLWDEAEGEDFILSLKSNKKDMDDDFDYEDY
ncbi:MAG: hypothetical protein IJI45_06870 [Anaerolineaceae bacterium]|nr:hypothetical protein [Anaerolineaceae bacterium]